MKEHSFLLATENQIIYIRRKISAFFRWATNFLKNTGVRASIRPLAGHLHKHNIPSITGFIHSYLNKLNGKHCYDSKFHFQKKILKRQINELRF